MDINRVELINQLVEKNNYTKKAATSLVDDFVDIIMDNLRNGNSVTLRGFGRFAIQDRAARACPNPKTGEMMPVPARKIPRFYPGTTMRMAVKLWEDDSKRGLV